MICQINLLTQEFNQLKIELQKTKQSIKDIKEKIFMLNVNQFAMTIGTLEQLHAQKQTITQKITQLSIIETNEISNNDIQTYLAS